ncbi:endoplasmic reticulum chaperone BiP-like isoform X2 [Haliotis rufescens]|uniref:endoplasmic reticulum chaperone BiP-like isoform X2 n=1 Tax=Haliotis rufescens TaxID=6454 RepID=UPI001EAFEB80|nr:endoplasmic reticulum chaperone BiP-like isoform X2 [Haliotis rufescens]
MRTGVVALCVVPLLGATCFYVEADANSKIPPTNGNSEKPRTVIAVDLGTDYSCVGVFRNDQVEIIPDEQGNRITPSYVAFTPDGETLIGHAARNQLTTNPENTVFDVKRLIGRTWDDPSVQRDIQRYPFKVINTDNKPHIQVRVGSEDKVFAPEELSAMVLSKMKEIAETYLTQNVTNAVVTVPAYFNDAQRMATKDAGTIAGLNILRLINEPSAASIAYGLNKSEGEKNVVVFDLGGGTFDVSLLTIDDGVIELVATNGDTHLDINQRLLEFFIQQYNTRTSQDLREDSGAIQKLRREVEKAKRALSSQHQTRVEIESLMGGHAFSEVLTRARLEALNIALFESTLKSMQTILDNEEFKRTDIREIVLVGAPSKIPRIRQLAMKFFGGKAPNKDIHPEEVVAYGAALEGAVIAAYDDTIDECFDLLEISKLSLGIETIGGVMTKIISRNTAIPTKRTQQFTTTEDDQDVMEILVYEGERAMTKDNHILGKFDLTGIPPALRGDPQINVTFEIDVNVILTVTAEDIGTGNKNGIVIQDRHGDKMSPGIIENMIQDAEGFAEEDKEMRMKTEAELRAGTKLRSRKAVTRKHFIQDNAKDISHDEL